LITAVSSNEIVQKIIFSLFSDLNRQRKKRGKPQFPQEEDMAIAIDKRTSDHRKDNSQII